jgi:hypothetical protein
MGVGYVKEMKRGSEKILSFLYAFRQLSEAKQKPTRYAGGDKRLYK